MNDIIMMPYGSAIEVTETDFFNKIKASKLGYEIDRFSCSSENLLTFRAKYQSNGFAHRKMEGTVLGYKTQDNKYYIAQWIITYINKH